ncbi:MAG: gentisate 1,2-dioxygenase [Gammaproteobacteria bacterium]|nr:gentisate 1,2-dioxygenase [Gammaproteobacteria bacterium]
MPNQRQRYYDDIAAHHMAPLWESLKGLITPTPRSACVPWVWRYEDIRASVMKAGEVITAKEAERRVLVLENPGMSGQSRITTSMYAGLQLILPGEVAPAHRHSPSALRFVVEGQGAFTSVNGEKTIMHEGDFVITPAWTWHDHGNDSAQPMVWLDGLDLHLAQFLDASFVESFPQEAQTPNQKTPLSLADLGAGLTPIGATSTGFTSPVFNYPYAHTREALSKLQDAGAPDPHHGYKLTYTNPLTGDYAMPTIGAFMQLLPTRFTSAPYRSTDATVFSVVEGTGTTTIGDQDFTWGPRDTFVVPSWHVHQHKTDAEAVLFSFSDRPVQDKLGFWREDIQVSNESARR